MKPKLKHAKILRWINFWGEVTLRCTKKAGFSTKSQATCYTISTIGDAFVPGIPVASLPLIALSGVVYLCKKHKKG